MLTRHGHHIPGTVNSGDIPSQFFVARCGGPALCEQCGKDASKILHPNDRENNAQPRRVIQDQVPSVREGGRGIRFVGEYLDAGAVAPRRGTDLVSRTPLPEERLMRHWTDENPCAFCGSTTETGHSKSCPNDGLYDEQEMPVPITANSDLEKEADS